MKKGDKIICIKEDQYSILTKGKSYIIKLTFRTEPKFFLECDLGFDIFVYSDKLYR